MEVQLEIEALQDTRPKEPQSQDNVKIQTKNTAPELEAADQPQEALLRKADSQTEHLRKMVHSHEEVLLELRGILRHYEDSPGKKLWECGNTTSLHIHTLSTALADVLRNFDSEVACLKGKLVLVEEELKSLKKASQAPNQLLLQQHHKRLQNTILEESVEVCGSTAKAKGAHSCANTLQYQMILLREQTRTQNSGDAHHIGHLEWTVSQLHCELQEARRMYRDKVKALEKQLHLAQCETTEAQAEQDQHSQEPGNLNDQIHQLLTELHRKEIELSLEKEQNKRSGDQNTDNSITINCLRRELDKKTMELQHLENTVREMRTGRQLELQMAAIKEENESIGRISSLSVQLESTKDTLRKVKEDLASKQMDLEAAERTVSDLTACLQEKERALGVSHEEIKELHSQLDRKMQELHIQKSEEARLHRAQLECQTLKLQVLEKQRTAEIFQKQIDSMTQVMAQHSRTAGAMEAEKSQLIKELYDWKLKAEEVKIAKDEKEARIHAMEARLSELELEKVKLLNTCTERLHALDDMKLQKEQLLNELQVSQSELAGLAVGFEDLKRNYQDKIKEMENTANRLKMQLKSAQAELEHTRTALKTMEGSDGNAMKVAVGMQKKITAKRGQIDALWSKIKFLEEAMANAAKEKHYLREENSKLSQELSCITAENTRLAGEMEILRSQDKCLKEKLSKMETALEKASKQFAEYQCIIQRQEQEAMRFRLQHTLDVKELQGPGYSSAFASSKLRHIVPLSHLQSALLPPSLSLDSCALPMPPKPDILKEEPLQDLKRILQELTGSDNDIPTVDHGKGDSNGGEKPSLATMRNTVHPPCFHTADLQSQNITLPFTSHGAASIFSAAPCYTSSPENVSQEQRYRAKSPVHMLLTSPPSDPAAGPRASPEHRLSTNKAGSPEATPTAPQITSQPMKSREQTPRRPQNKMESLQDLLGSLQIKNQAVSAMIRTQEVKTEKAKGKKTKQSELSCHFT
ncbi:coiled-coil domain-containing protein 158 [Dryobates pubescens]|uniref:coiled-coil domain-containing protein 158 n=1 Tax=Dryobates pubescens TaxID=118200 RepID=UPI0023B90EF8|nr:coiled-coil domain-containing protein 158 [Dryobates pubescens]